jgi:hypothetical protein
VREYTEAVILLAIIAIGMGRQPKAAAKVASASPEEPEVLKAIIAAAKLFKRNCTVEARVGMSIFAPSGPAHSNENEDDAALNETTRALAIPVTLTTRARASASTASCARQPLAAEKREGFQSADVVRAGKGIVMTASALVKEAEGHELVRDGKSAAEAAALRLHVPDALVFSMHAVDRVEVVGRET